MDRRGVAGVAAGLVGAAAGVAALIAGQPWGAPAALGAAAAAAIAVLADRDVASAGVRLRHAEQAQAAAERRAEEAHDGLAELSSRPGESVVDTASGLFDRRIFDVTFGRKLAAARRHLRPLTVIIIDLGPDLPADPRGRADILRRFGDLVTSTLRDADVPCRVGDTTFGVILEDTAEAGGIWVTDRLQLVASDFGVRLWRVAVATYPNHGLTSDEVLGHAWAVLGRMGASPGNRLNLPRGD
ncbi:MAG: hypothetical protein NVSMB12_10900 [Acidimicrobiales bacterium]